MVADPLPREEVIVGCEGSRRALTTINRRFIRWRCTQKRCKHPEASEERRIKTFHIADSVTGRLVTTEYEEDGRVIRPEEEQHGSG